MGIRTIYLFAFLFSLSSVIAFAQATALPNDKPATFDGHMNPKENKSRQRELTGVVKDDAGVPVESALVQLKDLKTGRLIEFITKQSGAYEFHELSMDIDYELTARRDGYGAPVTKKLSKYDSRRPATLNFELQGKKKAS